MRALAASAFLVAFGCAGAAVDVPDVEGAVSLASFSPSSVVPGTRLVLVGRNFRSTDRLTVHLVGAVDGARRLDVTLAPTLDSGERLFADVGLEVLSAAGGAGDFAGELRVEVEREGARSTATLAARLRIEAELTPVLEAVAPEVFYLGETVRLAGDGLLLGGHADVPEGGAEGELEVLASGTFRGDRGGTKTVKDFPLRVKATARDEAAYVHTNELFGADSGEFKGTLVPKNRHVGGQVVAGKPLAVSLLVLPSVVASMGKAAASREQRLEVSGRGFYASERAGVATLLRFKGRFKPEGGAEAAIDATVPLRVTTPDKGVLVLHPLPVESKLAGLGSQAGTFSGTVSPVLQAPEGQVQGAAWTGSFRVLPVKQVVLLKFTPQFTDALRLFGLRNVENAVRERIFEVVRRDYEGFNVEFRAEKPADFERYTTMELTGDDPNEADLFGLDNTDGKDDGNLRLDDYVGGANAESAASGSFAYGGVFLASFLRFSPNVCRKVENGIPTYKPCKDGSQFPLKSARFDGVFAPFAAILGGTEARADELASGPRKAALLEAVRVLGNLGGNTVTHELGHSLGLAQEIGLDEFHNAGDVPGQIMNPGGARPFEERAELDGQGPATWAPGDREYLERELKRP
jgi:hypothetical protein